jgi:hypothetical protein
MTFLIPLVLRYVPYLIAAVVLFGGVAYVKYRAEHWCNTICTDFREKYADADRRVQEAQKRAADLALLWAAEVDKTEAKNREAERERAEKFAALASRAKALSPRPVPISPDLDGLWRDTVRQANAARSSAEREAGANPVSESTYSEAELAEWFVASAAAYADAYGQWKSCVQHYENMQRSDAQP